MLLREFLFLLTEILLDGDRRNGGDQEVNEDVDYIVFMLMVLVTSDNLASVERLHISFSESCNFHLL